jgi:hypothetical protein
MIGGLLLLVAVLLFLAMPAALSPHRRLSATAGQSARRSRAPRRAISQPA